MSTQPDPDEQLQDLEDGIDATRREAEEHGTIPKSEPEQSFIDPDGDGRVDDDDEDPGASFAL